MRRRKAARGFTLLEMMISLALLSVLAVLFLGALSLATGLMERQREGQEYTEQQLVRRDVQTWMEWTTFTGLSVGAPAQFSGRADGFSYLGLVRHEDFPLYDTGRISVLFRDGELTASVEVASPYEDLPKLGRSGAVSGKATDVAFVYFGRKAPGEEKIWHQTWPLSRPPDLIKVEVQLESGWGWPPLVVVPRKALLYREMSASSPLPPG
ncbi:MAG: prepilin-type N-terminal cleavage/methylation domain-containing protein [Pseudomonadota bacterium]